MPFATTLVLAWGALAFGANYPWAYRPLLLVSLAVGVTACVAGRGATPWLFGGGLALIAAASLAQVVPVSPAWLAATLPATDRFLRSYDVSYALGASGHLSLAPAATLVGVACLVAFGTLAMGIARLTTPSSARTQAGLIAVLGALLAIVGVVERATYSGKIYGFWEPMAGASPFGPFVNRNHFAGWMLMAVPVTAGLFCANVARGMRGARGTLRDRVLWLSSPEASRTLLLGFALLLMCLAHVMTLSRSGITALGITALLAGAGGLRRQRTAAQRRVVGLSVAALLTCSVAVVGIDALVGRFGAADSATLSGRLPMWEDTLRIVRDFWPTGTGLNTFGVSTLLYQTVLPDVHLNEAHNDYLQLAAEGGLLVGIPIVATAAFFLVAVRGRMRRSTGSSYWIRAGAMAGLAAIAMQSLVEFSLQMPGNAALFAVVCGLALHEPEAG